MDETFEDRLNKAQSCCGCSGASEPTAPTSDRWIKVDEHNTIILTALSRITNIYCCEQGIKVYCGDSRSILDFDTLAEAEAFRDEILAKIDRL